MQRIDTRHPTHYPPLEQGQVLAMNDHCMKVNFGFRFIRGVLSGLIALMIVGNVVLDLMFDGHIANTLDWIASFKDYYIYIGSLVFIELYLWPSAPPMLFDRVNRRVIFQVFFRTKILDWDSCEGTIHYAAQVTESSATQGYNLRIVGNVINRKPGEKPQRAGALIHQSGVSDDLFNYWEYLRAYMDGGAEAVPKPSGIHQINPLWAALLAYHSNIPNPMPIFKAIGSGEGGIKGVVKNSIILLLSTFLLLATPLVYPGLLMIYVAGRTGRVRRYPKAIRQLCKEGRESAPASIPGKLKIHIDGKPLEIDWPVDEPKPPPPNKPPSAQ